MVDNLQEIAIKYSDLLVKEFSSNNMLKDEKIASRFVDYVALNGELPNNFADVLPLQQIKQKKMGEEVYNTFFEPNYQWAIPNNGSSSTFIDWLKHRNIIMNERYEIHKEFLQKTEEVFQKVSFRHEYKKNIIRMSEYVEYIEAVPELGWDDLYQIMVNRNKTIKFRMPNPKEYKIQDFDPKNTKTIQIIKIDQIPESVAEPIPSHLFMASRCTSKKCGEIWWDYKPVRFCRACGVKCRHEPQHDIIRNTHYGTCFISSTVDGIIEEQVYQFKSLDKKISGTDLKVACIVQEMAGRYILLILAHEQIYPEDIISWTPNPVEDVGYQIVKLIRKRYKEVFKRDFKGMDIILYSTVLLRIANEMGYKKNILFVGKGGVGKTYAFRIASFCITNPSLVALMNAGRVTSSGLTGSAMKVKIDGKSEITIRKPGLLTDRKIVILDEFSGPNNQESLDMRVLRNSLSENTITYGLSAGSGEIPKKASCMAIMNPPKKVENMIWRFLREYNLNNNRTQTIEDFHVLMGDRTSHIYKEFVKWARDKTEDYRTGMPKPDNDRFFLAFFSEEPDELPDRNPSALDDLTMKKKLYMPDVEAFINKRGRQYFDFSSRIKPEYDRRIYEFAKQIHKQNDFTSFGRVVEFVKTIAYAIMALNNQAIPDDALFHKISMIYNRTAHWKKPNEFEWTEEEEAFLQNPVSKQKIIELLDLEGEVQIIDEMEYTPRMA